jgi:hypothetical protein
VRAWTRPPSWWRRSSARRMYNTVTETVFRQCVHSFRTNTLSDDEKACLSVATTKLLRHTARVKQRITDFQEEQQTKLAESVKTATSVREAGLPSV